LNKQVFLRIFFSVNETQIISKSTTICQSYWHTFTGTSLSTTVYV